MIYLKIILTCMILGLLFYLVAQANEEIKKPIPHLTNILSFSVVAFFFVAVFTLVAWVWTWEWSDDIIEETQEGTEQCLENTPKKEPDQQPTTD